MTVSKTKSVVSVVALADIDPGQVGAKAANLGRLHEAGYRVPPFVVLTADASARILAPVAETIAGLLATLDHTDTESLRAVSWAARALITDIELPEDIAAELARAVATLGGGTIRFAVRSSVSGEDSATDSFAGQLDTLLNIAPGEVPNAVLACLASAYSERSLFYRAHRGLDNGRIDCAVLVQVLVDSAVSGVVFSCNPQSGDRGEAVVSAGLGLGEGIVSGLVECDTYFVDVSSQVINSQVIADKSSRVVAAASGTVVEEIGSGAVTSAALTESQVRSLVATAVDLAQRFGSPQDVEWAFDDAGALYLLQARPITATGARETIFDNANVAESYPGLSSPLTFSILRLAYEQVFRACHTMFGASDKIVDRNAQSLYPYLVGTSHGRIYYNISNWLRLFLLVPGMEFAIEGWEKALNIENRFKRQAVPEHGLARVRTSLLRARVIGIVIAGVFRLPGRLRTFFAVLDRFTADVNHRLDQATPALEREPHALLEWMERLIHELIPAYSVQMFNDFLAQQLFHVVGIMLERNGFSEAEAATLRNELFCGEEGMQSVEPVRSALALAALIRDDSALRELFASPDDPEVVWKTLERQRFSEFRLACLRHIALYGDRTVDELKLEVDPLGERPAELVPMLRNYVRGGQNIGEMEARERQIRRDAERRVAQAFRGKFGERLLFRFVLRRARENVKQRENMRLGRSRTFGLIKRVFREYGAQMHAAGLLDAPRDIFWLTYEEIAALTRGTAVDTDTVRIVATRKADHLGWADQEPPARIVTAGIAAAYVNDPIFEQLDAVDADADGAIVLRGIGCAPGRVRAPALVLTVPDPNVVIDGEVLIADTTDPGWVFLMVAAGGLVSEKGSVLSHTAIIGRELGIPTVVGVKNVTRLVATGDSVVIDGKAGTATITGRTTTDTGKEGPA